MPDELQHPYLKFSHWKFKLFRVRSTDDEDPMLGETPPRIGARPEAPPAAAAAAAVDPRSWEEGHPGLPGSVMKLCLGGKSKENVEGPGHRVDRKLQEMDVHMEKLRYEG